MTTDALSETVPDAPHRESSPAIERGQTIGRFVVLEQLGTGGMGVVYAAYDANLDRKVAIKLLRSQAAESDEARVRLLREAQAMARIDHPNVLRVHEAGTLGERIFIAMEFASGGTLRSWLARELRSTQDVVRVFAQAGRGLAAAHAAGLVHRDFKPDNVLLVGDGQARVTDFGLVGVVGEQPAARPSGDLDKPLSENTPLSRDLTRTGALMGTPAYMSPEQFCGGLVGPAADQFAFCVALYEAVYHARPFGGATFPELCASVVAGAIQPPPKDSDVPARIRRVLMRGLAQDADRRYPSMELLLADLVADGGNPQRTVLVAVAACIAVGGALGAVFALNARNTAACSGAEARIATVWGDAQRHELATAIDAPNRPYTRVVRERAIPLVDAWARSWQAGYLGACEDTRVRKVQSEHLMDLRVQCLNHDLDAARTSLEALSASRDGAIDHAIDVARALPSIAACADTETLQAEVAPPPPEARDAVERARAKFDRAAAQYKLEHYPDAIALANEALAEARATNYAPMIARALLLVGRLQLATGDANALDTIATSMRTAAAAGDVETMMRAASRRVVKMAYKGNFPIGDEISATAEALAAHATLRPETRVDLEDAVGLLFSREGKQDDAQKHYERALQIATKELPADHSQTITTLSSLAVLAAERHQFTEAKKLFEQVLAAEERVVGKDNRDYALALDNLASVHTDMGDVLHTKEMWEQSLAIRVAALGPDAPDVATSYSNLGTYYASVGNYGEAKASYEKALAIQHKLHGEGGIEASGTQENLGLVLTHMGDYEGARALLEQVRALSEKTYGADDPRVGGVLTNLASVATEQHRYDEALGLLARSHAMALKTYGAGDATVLDIENDQVETYTKANKLGEARELASHVLSAAKGALAADDVVLAHALANAARLQLEKGDFAGALATYDRAAPIFEAKLGSGHPDLAFALAGKAKALVKLHRDGEAAPLFERALAIATAARIAPSDIAELQAR
jgi:tetratricopeptide (TPR) repeat protein/predicted Ser/Thr protein kinase